ncbi:uncharacterized protein DS421_17g594450 [Arachis hypogaea]|nr:uncharacterized protein DS421_17g594450 [Arachis hypogaea]
MSHYMVLIRNFNPYLNVVVSSFFPLNFQALIRLSPMSKSNLHKSTKSSFQILNLIPYTIWYNIKK